MVKVPLSLVKEFINISGIEVITDSIRVKRLSQDFNWYSPILKEELSNKSADFVIRPLNVEALMTAVAIIAKRRIPLTVRGSGTGNYGQCVPLMGGIVLDLSLLAGVSKMQNNMITSYAGTRLVDIDTYALQYGSEIRMFPSTFRSASVGGFFCGGSGGVGSLIYGRLADPGNIKEITICSVDENPRLTTLQDENTLGIHHAYGTNGIVVDVTLPVERIKDWVEQLYTFDTIYQAMDFCDYVSTSFTNNVRLLSLLEAPIASFFKSLEIRMSPKDHAVIAMTDKESSVPIKNAAIKAGGKTIITQLFSEVRIRGKTLIECTWNHTTLHAIKVDKQYTYLQAGYGSILEYRNKLMLLKKNLGDEMVIHLEYVRNNGKPFVGGLPLIRYLGSANLNEIIGMHENAGVTITNPHVYTINQIGGLIPKNLYEYKERFDPLGLMNKNKLPLITNPRTEVIA